MLSALVLVGGCAVKRIENGVYHSPKGYRVTIPGDAWMPYDDSPADLELRHRGSSAGLAIHALCEGPAPRRPIDPLARQLLIGVRDREVIEREATEVAGRPASRTVLDGRLGGTTARVRMETLVMTDGRCVYDFMHVAPPATFESTRPDFTRLLESFRTE